mgnify:CR=1 FL=1
MGAWWGGGWGGGGGHHYVQATRGFVEVEVEFEVWFVVVFVAVGGVRWGVGGVETAAVGV